MFERVSNYFANFAAVILNTQTEIYRKYSCFDDLNYSKSKIVLPNIFV